MTADISQVTTKNIPPSPETLSLLCIWTLPEALENRSVLWWALNIPTFCLSRDSSRAAGEGWAGISHLFGIRGAPPLKWCWSPGGSSLAHAWDRQTWLLSKFLHAEKPGWMRSLLWCLFSSKSPLHCEDMGSWALRNRGTSQKTS